MKRDGHIAAIEIVHLARSHVNGAHRQSWLCRIDPLEIGEALKRFGQLLGRIESRLLHTNWRVETPSKRAIRREVAGNAVEDGHHVRGSATQTAHTGERHRSPEWLALHLTPELLNPFQPLIEFVAGDDGGVDGSDRRADDPIRLDSRLVEGLINPALIGSQRPTALKHNDHLAGQGKPLGRRRSGLVFDVRFVHGSRPLQDGQPYSRAAPSHRAMSLDRTANAV